MNIPDQPIDLVYTWVDDSFPGYSDTLARYADAPRDRDPNRTRDNLDTLRFSLRSVWQHLPDVRSIYIFTCRPQVPSWLDTSHPRIKLVHHDEVIAARYLPTFNSFCIVSHLHLLPGVSRQFLYFEDDVLANSDDLMGAMYAPDGRPWVHLESRKVVPHCKLDTATASPWNLSLANADDALTKRFGAKTRRHIIHGPQILDCDQMDLMCQEFPDLIEATRTAKFRSGKTIPPEFLARHLALETGAASLAPCDLSHRVQGYTSVENLRLWTWLQINRINRRKPLSITLNDSFGETPNPKVETMVKKQLETWFPDPAPWELPT